MAPDPARLLTVGEVERALDEGGLRVHYQPCYDLRTGEIVAVEALARLADPATGGLLAPASFLGAIEGTPTISRLDAMVFAEAAARVARWRRVPGGSRLCVAVNISAADLDMSLPDSIRKTAAAAGLALDAVIIELTETLLSRTGQGHERVLSQLASLGCNVTLDDFGTGNASFDYLRRFRVDGIKIDRSFVQFLGSGSVQERMAESLIRFCLSLGVHVVAEGIEHPRHVAALRRLGCPFGQGFLMSRPLPPEEIEALLNSDEVLSGVLAHRSRGADVATIDLQPVIRRAQPRNRAASRTLATLLCGALVALGVLSTMSERSSHDSLERAARDRLEAVASLASSRVETQVGGLRDVVSAYARTAAVDHALRTRDATLVRASLEGLGSATTGVHSSSLYDPDGTMLALAPAAPGVVGRNFAFRDWYQGARQADGAYVSEAFQLLTTERPWAVAVAAAARDAAGHTQGYVVVTMTLEALQDQLDELLAEHGVRATLVDVRGTTLASPRGEVGGPNSDPRFVTGVTGSGTVEARIDEGESLWALGAVPSVGGSLLAEQPHHAELGGAHEDTNVGMLVMLVVVGSALLVVVVWLHTDRRRQRLETELGEANDWLRSIMSATPTPLVVTDGNDRVQVANPAAAALLGVPVESLAGQTLASWLPVRDQPARDAVSYQASMITAKGDLRLVDVHPQALAGPDGGLVHLHALVDVTPHRQEQDRLRAESRVDPLTGVGNRIAFRESLVAALVPGPSSYALMMLDLDGFKAVNDVLGHAVGDSLLCAVADALADAVQAHDSVARIGGDEFALVLRLDAAARREDVAAGLVARVQAAIDAHAAAEQVEVGVSIGSALIGVDGSDADALLHVADVRMYEDKRSGVRV